MTSSQKIIEPFKSLVARLQLLAQQILTTEADYILVLEEYTSLLGILESRLSEAGEQDKESLNKLEAMHIEVFAKVSAEKDLIREKITGLKKKGKAVITYTDTLPKRISLGATKKA